MERTVDDQADDQTADSLAVDADGQTEEPAPDLGKKSFQGGVATAAAQVSRLVISIGSAAILGRILTPDDYGLVMGVTSVTGIAKVIGDLGLSMATIQKDRVTKEQVNVLFWINVVFGFVTMLGVAAMGPMLANFYEDPAATNIAFIVAVSGLLTSLGVQPEALLRRDLKLGAVSAATVISLLLAAIVTIALAPRLGYYALALNFPLQSGFRSAAVWVASGWVPSLPNFSSDVRSLLKFGRNLTLFNIGAYAARSVDNILIRKQWGADKLGLYSRAYALLLLPMQQIAGPFTAVAVPLMSRYQKDAKKYRELYCKGCALAALLQFPVSLFAGTAAEEIVVVLLGSQWIKAAPIFVAMIPAAIAGATSPASNWVLLSLGQSGRYLKLGLFNYSCVIAAFFIGLPYGPIGVATAYSICSVALRLPSIVYSLKESPIKLTDAYTAMRDPAIAVAIAFAAGWAVGYWTDPLLSDPANNESIKAALGLSAVDWDLSLIHLVALLVKAFVYGVTYLVAAWLLPNSRRSIQMAVSLTSDMLRRRSKGQSLSETTAG